MDIKIVLTTFTLVFLSTAMRNKLTCHLLTIINAIRHKIPLQSKCLETFFSTTIYKDNNNSSFGNFCITMNNLNVLFMSK